ncbi:MAG: carboxypeptidase-like regulatory domain-containing protein [Parcubacteria group bacterium]
MNTHGKKNEKLHSGFAFLETIVVIGIIGLVAQVIVLFTSRTLSTSRETEAWSIASGLATEQIELVRNTSYANIGTVGGIPSGVSPKTQTIERANVNFTVNIVVKEFDDPYDGNAQGTIQGKPLDTVPADYKKVEVNVCWDTRSCANPVRLTSTFSPRNLETASDTGSLFITVLDANGNPAPTVTIRVTNTNLNPDLDATNTTDIDGKLQLLSMSPDIGSYHVEATKTGYTTDSTLPPTPQNPNPSNPDTTVGIGQVTEVVLYIDLVSTVTTRAEQLSSCGMLADIPIQLTGERLIGSNPDVIRNNLSASTDATGTVVLNNVEWDNYRVSIASLDYILAGTDPPAPVYVAANSNVTIRLFLAPATTPTLLVTVTDTGTGLPIADSQVRVEGNGYDQINASNQGAFFQTDWSGGSGQQDYVNLTKYFADDGNIKTDVAGEITLPSQTSRNYPFTENFNTTTYRDDAVTTANWTTSAPYEVHLADDPDNPGQYLTSGTEQSTKLNSEDGLITKVTMSAAEQPNGQTIEYYVAADGASFERITPNTDLYFASPGSDLRWRAVLSTTDTTVTPRFNELVFHYTYTSVTATDGWLESSSLDTGGQSTYSTIQWNPQSQPEAAGPNVIGFQVATNDDDATWNYLGPDGTAGTYYRIANETVSDVHTNHRYLRYKVFLHTDTVAANPTLTDFSIIYTNLCLPPGQVFFSSLPVNGDYTVTVDHPGYQQAVQTVSVDGNTQVIIFLTPNA